MNDYDSFVCVLVAMNPDNTDNGCCTGTWNCWKYFGNTFGSSNAQMLVKVDSIHIVTHGHAAAVRIEGGISLMNPKK